MIEQATYAHIGGPPDWWQDAVVIDLDTKEEIRNVFEADTNNGWVLSITRDEDGKPVGCNGDPPCAFCIPPLHPRFIKRSGNFVILRRLQT